METAESYGLRTWAGLVVLCLGAAVTLLNMASLSPLLRAIGQEFGTSDATTGQLATLGSLVSVAAALLATPWMDRWSRRTWLRLEGLLVLVGFLVAALAPTFAWLIAGRAISSFGSAVIMANCLTGARELFRDPIWRNRAIGIIVSATTLAFVIGLPIMTQLAAHFGWRAALASLAVPVILLLIGTFALPSTQSQPVVARRPGPLVAFRSVLGESRTRCLLIVVGLSLGLYAGWLVYFATYATDTLAASAGVVSALFLLSGLSELAANNLTPPLLRRFGAISVLYAMLASVAAVLLLTGIVITTVTGALIAAVAVLNGTASAYIAVNALLLDGEISHPGAVMSVASAATGVGSALGPFVAGWSLSASGSFEAAYRTLGLLAPLAMIVLWLGTRRPAPASIVERASGT